MSRIRLTRKVTSPFPTVSAADPGGVEIGIGAGPASTFGPAVEKGLADGKVGDAFGAGADCMTPAPSVVLFQSEGFEGPGSIVTDAADANPFSDVGNVPVE